MNNHGFIDSEGDIIFGIDDFDIVMGMKKLSWLNDENVYDYKRNVQSRCKFLGVELVFNSPTTFLNELERVGLGSRINPDFNVKKHYELSQNVKKNQN